MKVFEGFSGKVRVVVKTMLECWMDSVPENYEYTKIAGYPEGKRSDIHESSECPTVIFGSFVRSLINVLFPTPVIPITAISNGFSAIDGASFAIHYNSTN